MYDGGDDLSYDIVDNNCDDSSDGDYGDDYYDVYDSGNVDNNCED